MSIMSTYGSGVGQCVSTTLGLRLNRSPGVGFASINARPRHRRSETVVVRAEAQTINLEIRKTEEKVVDSVVVTELSKPLTAYCRLVLSVLL